MLAGPSIGFDYNLSYFTIRNLTDLSFAHYHTRRHVSKDRWQTVVLPFADFQCAYGIGSYSNRFAANVPLTGEDLMAVAFLSPFQRQSAVQCTIIVDHVSLVQVPGAAAEHRSFWQVPAMPAVRLVSDPAYLSYGGFKHMRAHDTNAPSVPHGLAISAVSTTDVTLVWSASSDDTGVAGYDIMRDGIGVGTALTTNHTDRGLAPATHYTYAVRAFDQMGNHSSASATNSVMTLPEPMLLALTAGLSLLRRSRR